MRTNRASASESAPTRERILAAALAGFAENGFDGATLRDIAARARVPLGLVRYHFGSKAGLWRAAVDEAFAEVGRGLAVPLDELAQGCDELAAVRAAVRAHVRYVARHPEFVRLLHDEGKRRGPRMRWIVDRHVKPMFAQLLPLMRHLQERGRLPSDIDPLHFVYGLIGAIDVIFHQAEECQRVTGVDPRAESAVEAHARAVEFMLLGAPPTPATDRAPRRT